MVYQYGNKPQDQRGDTYIPCHGQNKYKGCFPDGLPVFISPWIDGKKAVIDFDEDDQRSGGVGRRT